MKRILFILSLLPCVGLVAETSQRHELGAGSAIRRVSPSSQAALFDAISACTVGRAGTPSRDPALNSNIIDVLPTSSAVSGSGAISRQPTLDPDFPGDDFFSSCLAKLPPSSERCVSVLGECEADTIDGGRVKIRPIFVKGGDPCSAREEMLKIACSRGIEPDRFKSGDASCRPSSSTVE